MKVSTAAMNDALRKKLTMPSAKERMAKYSKNCTEKNQAQLKKDRE